MSKYYDPKGNELTTEEWVELFGKRLIDSSDWWIVGKDSIDNITISTVWLGLDYQFADEGPPLIFESMIFGGDDDGETLRYSTWQEAERGHKELVEKIRNGKKD